MPSIALRPGARTYYLDTSTLSYAFDGAARGFGELRIEVERIARNENLCVSLMHIKEFAQLPNEAVSSGLVDWLDALETVWTLGADQVTELEDERALQLSVGVERPAAVNIFAGSMLAAFRSLSPRETADALFGRRPLHTLFKAAQDLTGQHERTMMAEMQRRFHHDRFHDPMTKALSNKEKAERLSRKLRADLELDAGEARERLRGKNICEFHERARATPNLPAVFADFALANPAALPAYFVGLEFNSRFADKFARRDPEGERARDFDSSFYDWAHAVVGAAYCDVFTCDKLTRDCLVGAREALGFGAPIVYEKNDAAAFVAALRATSTISPRALVGDHGRS